MERCATLRRSGLVRLLVAICVAILCGAAGGCSGASDSPSESASDTAGTTGKHASNDSREVRMPDREPDLNGRVVSVEPGDSKTTTSAGPAGILVEKEPAESTTARRDAPDGAKGALPGKGQRYLINLKITPETLILAHTGDGEPVEASAAGLAPAQSVEVWHSPEMGRSYPAQAGAHTILIR